MDVVARSALIAALNKRLAELPEDAAPDHCHPAPDSEEALRQLMVVSLPRLAKYAAEQRALVDAMVLLSSIEGAAHRDLRFLDAFNSYHELMRDAPRSWRSEYSARAIGIYRRILAQVVHGMKSGVVPSVAAPPLENDSDSVIAWDGIAPQRILILADNALVATRILEQVSRRPEFDVSVLICNAGRSGADFVVRQTASLLRSVRGSSFAHLGSLARGKWKFSSQPLHAQPTLDWVRKNRFDVGLHGMGVIYRRALLDSFRIGVLNAHIGYLPTFRGRSVLEWSLLAGRAAGVTVFFIDEGIDTGERIVTWRPAPEPFPPSLDAFKRQLFDMDGAMYATGLQQMLRKNFVFRRNIFECGRRYYVMSELLRSVVTQVLTQLSHRGMEQAPDAI